MGGKKVDFCNEDNAISYLGLLEMFFELLCENKDYGYDFSQLHKVLIREKYYQVRTL